MPRTPPPSGENDAKFQSNGQHDDRVHVANNQAKLVHDIYYDFPTRNLAKTSMSIETDGAS